MRDVRSMIRRVKAQIAMKKNPYEVIKEGKEKITGKRKPLKKEMGE